MTREGAVEMLKQFFPAGSVNEITVQQAFSQWERNPDDQVTNKSWLSNKLTHLKIHRLAEPMYGRSDKKRRTLTGIKLLPEGMKALGRASDIQEIPESIHHYISLEDIMKQIPRLQKDNPEFNITFSVNPK